MLWVLKIGRESDIMKLKLLVVLLMLVVVFIVCGNDILKDEIKLIELNIN